VGDGRASQTAFAVLLGFFRGLLVGFLIAGYRVAGAWRLPLGRPRERPAGFGALAGEPSAHSSRGNPRRSRTGDSRSWGRGRSHGSR
jgi:hypothetical protein